MSDITDFTSDITIYSADGVNAVTVVDDSGTYRLAVDASVDLSDTTVGIDDSDGTQINPAIKQFQVEQKFLLNEVVKELKMMNFLLKQMADIDIDMRSINGEKE